MFSIDDPSAAVALPTPEAAGTEGFWTEGNPALGVPATLIRASWLNMVQSELRNVVVAAGLTPSKTVYNQVLSAIQMLTQNGASIIGATSGTADAIIGTFSPVPASATNGAPLMIRAALANATATPTFTPNSGVITPAVIVKGNNLPLVAGDIAGAGHWLELQWDATLSRWVLQNPANGVVAARGYTQGATTATTSGTSKNITGIPSWAKRICIAFNAVGFGSTDGLRLQIGPVAGVETTGYLGNTGNIGSGGAVSYSSSATDFRMASSGSGVLTSGTLTLTLQDAATNTWAVSGNLSSSNLAAVFAGAKPLAGVLTQFTLSGTGGNTFSAGSFSYTYEG